MQTSSGIEVKKIRPREAHVVVVRGGLAVRACVLLAGLLVFATGIVAMYEARLGLSPWDVLHQGLARHTPLSFGEANIAVSVLVLTAAWLLGASIGVGTVCNAVGVGLFVQLFSSLRWVAALSSAGLNCRVALLGGGVILVGVGTGLYVSAGLGAGPRGSLMLVAARRTRLRIRVVRRCSTAACSPAGRRLVAMSA